MIPILLTLLIDSGRMEQSESVDWIECNRVVRCQGEEGFRQVIFWSLNQDGEKECRGWLPEERVEITGRMACIRNRKGSCLVRFGFSVHTVTDHDPEIEHRKIIPLEKRDTLRAIK